MSEPRTRHPLSAAFGDMPEPEFAELVADIKKNGLITAIVTAEDGSILDGWHRYRACIDAGIKPRFEPFDYVVEPAAENVGGKKISDAEFVNSQNAHRRHLTRDQKRQIVVELLKTKPEASDRAIASMAKVSDKTVGAQRKGLQATAEIPQLTKTTGKDGKARATQKQRAIRKIKAEGALPKSGPKALNTALDKRITSRCGAAPGGSHTFEAADLAQPRDLELMRVIVWLQYLSTSDITNWKAMRGPLLEQVARLDAESVVAAAEAAA